jgi:integrase
MKCRQMPIYETTSDGRRIKRPSRKYYAIFRDWTGADRRMPLFASRKASDEAAGKIDKLNRARATGDTLTPELSDFVRTVPPRVRNKLVSWGIVTGERASAGKPLVDHLADWKAALLAKGNTARHADLASGRATTAFAGAGFMTWPDISASKLQAYLADRRKDRTDDKGARQRGLSAQTSNFYLQACKQFCRWMIRDARAAENPLDYLQGLNVRTDRRHDRRALSSDELRWLLDATSKAPERFGMGGAERAMLYRLAVETGLRAGELRSLTRSSFQLAVDEPNVTIAAAYAKNLCQDTLPLRASTAAALLTCLGSKLPTAQAFAVPPRTEVSRMFRADLSAARTAWIAAGQPAPEREAREGSHFLANQDDAGRWADFHALRHTFISNLASGGVHPKTAQTLARHSTITLTMDRYSHVRRAELVPALDALPDLDTPAVERAYATGTAGSESLSVRLRVAGEFGSSGAKLHALKSANTSKTRNALNRSEKSSDFADSAAFDSLKGTLGRSGRVVECAGLENR